MKKHLLLIPAVFLVASCGGGSGTQTQELGAGTPSSVIQGQIRTSQSVQSAGEVNVSVRGSGDTATVNASSPYSLAVPASDTAQTVVLDFTGENVVEKSISVFVPPNAASVDADVDIGVRTTPIAFNLDTGAELMNPDSPTRTSVSVPPNAFQLPDGTTATGAAQVSITEIDIQDYDAETSWVPDLVGVEANGGDEVALTSFGMSDFHFTQNGETLQLRPGFEATIKMDLISDFSVSSADGSPVATQSGDTMPLWYYDNVEMVWKEEGMVTVSSDPDSSSGFSAAGKVSHFSTWNIDKWTPSMLVEVPLSFKDSNGVPIVESEDWVVSYRVSARTPNPSWNGEAVWRNSRTLTPDDRRIRVLANGPDRQTLIDTQPQVGGFVEMIITIEDIVFQDAYTTDGWHGRHLPTSQTKIFRTYDGDDSISFVLTAD